MLPQDMDQVGRLWQECFCDPQSYADFYFRTMPGQNRILGLKEKERLISMIHLNPYVLSADGRRFDSTYIVGVATDAAYRHQGHMRRLLDRTFECLYGERQPMAYLMPADPKIYEPFGFRYIYQQFYIKMPAANTLGEYLRTAGDVGLRAYSASPADARQLAEWANDCLGSRMDVFTWRDERYYDNLLRETASDGGEVLMFYEGERLVGTAAYIAEETYEVREILAYPGYEPRLVGWLAGHLGDRAGMMLMPPWKADEAGVENGFRPMIMGRILYLESFLRLLRFDREADHLCLEVKDDLIQENNGSFRIVIRNGKAEKVTRLDHPEAGCLKVTVEMLMQAAFGQGSALQGIQPFEHIFINEIV